MRDDISSLHADLRLMQRSGQIDLSMTELWEESIPCDVKYHSYDEARVSAEHDIVLLKENGQIVTVLPETYNVTIDGERFETFIDGVIDNGRE